MAYFEGGESMISFLNRVNQTQLGGAVGNTNNL